MHTHIEQARKEQTKMQNILFNINLKPIRFFAIYTWIYTDIKSGNVQVLVFEFIYIVNFT